MDADSFAVGDVLLAPDMMFTIGFRTGEDTRDSVQIIADFLKRHPSFVIELASHTDQRGSEEANQVLSQKRADIIRDLLISEHDIAPERIVSRGYGESKPLVSGAEIQQAPTKEAQEMLYRKNRRLEIAILEIPSGQDFRDR